MRFAILRYDIIFRCRYAMRCRHYAPMRTMIRARHTRFATTDTPALMMPPRDAADTLVDVAAAAVASASGDADGRTMPAPRTRDAPFMLD